MPSSDQRRKRKLADLAYPQWYKPLCHEVTTLRLEITRGLQGLLLVIGRRTRRLMEWKNWNYVWCNGYATVHCWAKPPYYCNMHKGCYRKQRIQLIIQYISHNMHKVLLWVFSCEYIDSLVQDCSNSSALGMELLQSCTQPSISGFSRFEWCFHPYQFKVLSIIPISTIILVRRPWNNSEQYGANRLVINHIRQSTNSVHISAMYCAKAIFHLAKQF